jgi:hypothetical protein
MGASYYLQINKWTQAPTLDGPETPIADLDHVDYQMFLNIYVVGAVPRNINILRCQIDNQGKVIGSFDFPSVNAEQFKGTIGHDFLIANNEYLFIIADSLDKPFCLCSATIKTLSA